MLTKQDLKAIGDLFDIKFDEKFDKKFDEKFDEKIGEFAILMQKEFSNIYKILETKADKSDIERLEDKIVSVEKRVVAVENKFDMRLPKLEDDMRLVKTKLKIS